jgi:hypothetical protein
MEVGRKIRRELRKRSGVRALPIPDLADQLIVVRGFEGWCAHRELVEHRPKPVDVRVLGRTFASDHFRCEIGDGAGELTFERKTPSHIALDSREAEVRELHTSFAVDENVSRGDIAMKHAVNLAFTKRMCIAERRRDPFSDPHDLAPCEPSVTSKGA